MKNPFIKLVRENHGSMEEMKVVDTNFEIRDGDVYVQDIYGDGSTGMEWVPLHVDPNDTEDSKAAYRQYRQDKGIME